MHQLCLFVHTVAKRSTIGGEDPHHDNQRQSLAGIARAPRVQTADRAEAPQLLGELSVVLPRLRVSYAFSCFHLTTVLLLVKI